MPLVEGVGDEVTQFFLVLLLVLLGLAAWWSTQIADTPLVRTVLILERRTRSPQIRPLPRTPADPPAQTDPAGENTETEQTQQDAEEQSATQTEVSAENSTNKQEGDEQPTATPQDESPECQLRRRRIAFLENMTSPSRTPEVAPETEEDEEEAEVSTGEGSIRIRLKYLNDEQKLVEGRLQEPLGDFRRRHFRLELGANKLVRLIFNGQVLVRDAASLQEHGLFDNCVVHCLVHQPRTSPDASSQQTQQPQQQPQPQQQGREWDLGSVIFMFLSVMLGLAWYGRCMYSQYFTTTASVALVGLTGVFVVSVVGLMLPDQDGLRQ